MKNVSKKVLAYIAKHPDAKPQQVANACKAKVAYVYAIISKAKKQAESDLLFKASQGRAKLRGRPPMRMRTVAMFTSDKPLSRMIATNAQDNVNHPEHYKTGGIETIDFIEAKNLGYHLGNVIKYITRADHKGNRLEDLKKAQWYLNRAVSNLEK
jgi:homoserine dehydrogenase